MIVVDLNLLLYAVNGDAPDHERCRSWWERCLSQSEPVGLAWAVILGFLRLTTHPRIMPRPIDIKVAIDVVSGWLEQPQVRLLQPTERHWGILSELLSEMGAAGNVTSDAHLAALAIEYGAALYSVDSDFSRYARLKWINPLA